MLIPANDYSWRGLRAVLANMPDFRVLGETMDPGQAVELARKLIPNVILLSTEPGERAIVSLIRELRASSPASKLAIFTDHIPTTDLLDGMATLGVASCVLWNDLSPASLSHFLVMMTDARLRIASESVAAAFLATHRHRRPPGGASMHLPEMQRTVLSLLIAGLSTKAIATRLGVTRTTVSTHISRLKDRLGAETREQLIAVALRNDLLDEDISGSPHGEGSYGDPVVS